MWFAQVLPSRELSRPRPAPCTLPGSPPPAPHAHHLPSKRAWAPAASASPELRASADTPGPAAPGPRGSTSPHPRLPPAPPSGHHTSLLRSANSPGLLSTPALLSFPPEEGQGAAPSIPNPAGWRNPRPPRGRASHLYPAAGLREAEASRPALRGAGFGRTRPRRPL